MCGIVGLVGRVAPGSKDPLRAALDDLAPRGPDGIGEAAGTLGAWPVRFGSRRLLLVDAEERQPVTTERGGLLVLNGEVYNHAALRRELEAAGTPVPGAGDAAVLAALLEREGPAGLRRVEGSYAFGFLAGADGPLLLGRDPLGVRPLAFALLPDGLAFASTVTALLAAGVVPRQPDLEALADVLRDGVVSTRRTAIRGVRRVAPGEVLCVDRGLGIRTEIVRPPPFDLPSEGKAPDDAGEPGDVLGALRAAVGDRLRTQRACAVFLSGGVDSALVAALAREAGAAHAYTLTFPGRAAVDESRRARQTARRLGLEHTEVTCPEGPHRVGAQDGGGVRRAVRRRERGADVGPGPRRGPHDPRRPDRHGRRRGLRGLSTVLVAGQRSVAPAHPRVHARAPDADPRSQPARRGARCCAPRRIRRGCTAGCFDSSRSRRSRCSWDRD